MLSYRRVEVLGAERLYLRREPIGHDGWVWLGRVSASRAGVLKTAVVFEAYGEVNAYHARRMCSEVTAASSPEGMRLRAFSERR
jgi:hypothetical protein